jgi:hypothetical protein
MATIVWIALSAFSCTSAGAMPASGWGIETRRGAGIPLARDIDLAKEINASLQITTVGIPFFSNSVESWILHDVQEPQSETP